MISERDLRARVAEWALRDDVVEKDYVLGWVLAGIGTEPALRDGWVFKGGTCLKKPSRTRPASCALIASTGSSRLK